MSKSYDWSFNSAQKPNSKLMLWLYNQYVLDCPVKGVSARSCDFSTLGWSGHSYLTLASAMKSESNLANQTWRYVKDAELNSTLRELGVFNKYTLDKELCVYAKGDKQKVEGLFYMIRNALAHGSFRYHCTKTGEYLVMQTSRNGKLRGRAVIKIDTLKRWRSLLNNRRKYLK